LGQAQRQVRADMEGVLKSNQVKVQISSRSVILKLPVRSLYIAILMTSFGTQQTADVDAEISTNGVN
jgi:hypothetical protein